MFRVRDLGVNVGHITVDVLRVLLGVLGLPVLDLRSQHPTVNVDEHDALRVLGVVCCHPASMPSSMSAAHTVR